MGGMEISIMGRILNVDGDGVHQRPPQGLMAPVLVICFIVRFVVGWMRKEKIIRISL